MKILLTGASSFTGYWFAKALNDQGHTVVAPLTKTVADYDGVRGLRVKELLNAAEVVENCSFGSDLFGEIISTGSFDALCHHAANVTDYKSEDFDIISALDSNTKNIRSSLESLAQNSSACVVLTGSVFEQNEGAGSKPMRAFSPYGLSKGLTSQVFDYFCQRYGLNCGKFVIPNPFGPFEEPRFTAYLMKNWLANNTASVRTPDYVRDNIHVSLLASAYAKFVGEVANARTPIILNPSQYVESQGSFAQRFQSAMQAQLGLECGLELGVQEEFDEPIMRVNTDLATHYVQGWNESDSWKAMCDFYRSN